MRDGSDAVSDWPLLNALLNTASGATWVSLHHGGGVGMGYSQHAGMVVVCDGTEAASRSRIARVLWNDPASGVMRHADAGYDEALECAAQRWFAAADVGKYVMSAAIVLGAGELTLEQLRAAWADDVTLALDASAKHKVAAASAAVSQLLESGDQVYGVNTGFGQLAHVRISKEELDALQDNLVRSHACGVGPLLAGCRRASHHGAESGNLGAGSFGR